MNKLQNTQLYNRKCLSLANHPKANNYEEAIKEQEKEFMENTIFYQGNSIYREYIDPCNIYQNIGKPLKLDKVLKGLGNLIKQCNYDVIMELDTGLAYCSIIISLSKKDKVFSFMWDLNQDTLEKQSESSQEDLKKILQSLFLLDINGLRIINDK